MNKLSPHPLAPCQRRRRRSSFPSAPLLTFIRLALIRLALAAIAILPSIALTLIICAGSNAHAEYRLYRLKITDTTTKASRLFLSTLDNVQYRTYHQVHPNEQVTIDAHWWCWDRPGERYPRDYCPQPNGPTPKFTALHYQP